jgi:hypothetical protein
MMETVVVLPVLYKPDGTHQRLTGLSAVKTITFAPHQHAIWIQTLSQNVRITTDGTTPTSSGNDTGFVLYAGHDPATLEFAPGTTLKLIQEAASAVVQYQMLTAWTRYDT